MSLSEVDNKDQVRKLMDQVIEITNSNGNEWSDEETDVVLSLMKSTKFFHRIGELTPAIEDFFFLLKDIIKFEILKPNTILYHEGEMPEKLYFILKGKATQYVAKTHAELRDDYNQRKKELEELNKPAMSLDDIDMTPKSRITKRSLSIGLTGKFAQTLKLKLDGVRRRSKKFTFKERTKSLMGEGFGSLMKLQSIEGLAIEENDELENEDSAGTPKARGIRRMAESPKNDAVSPKTSGFIMKTGMTPKGTTPKNATSPRAFGSFSGSFSQMMSFSMKLDELSEKFKPELPEVDEKKEEMLKLRKEEEEIFEAILDKYGEEHSKYFLGDVPRNKKHLEMNEGDFVGEKMVDPKHLNERLTLSATEMHVLAIKKSDYIAIYKKAMEKEFEMRFFFQKQFPDEDPEIMKQFATLFHKKAFTKDEVIFSEGEKASKVYILKNGMVALYKTIEFQALNKLKPTKQDTLSKLTQKRQPQTKSMIVAKIHQGEFFGEEMILGIHNREFKAVAAELDVEAYVLDKGHFHHVKLEFQNILRKLSSAAKDKMQWRKERISEMIEYTVNSKLNPPKRSDSTIISNSSESPVKDDRKKIKRGASINLDIDEAIYSRQEINEIDHRHKTLVDISRTKSIILDKSVGKSMGSVDMGQSNLPKFNSNYYTNKQDISILADIKSESAKTENQYLLPKAQSPSSTMSYRGSSTIATPKLGSARLKFLQHEKKFSINEENYESSPTENKVRQFFSPKNTKVSIQYLFPDKKNLDNEIVRHPDGTLTLVNGISKLRNLLHGMENNFTLLHKKHPQLLQPVQVEPKQQIQALPQAQTQNKAYNMHVKQAHKAVKKPLLKQIKKTQPRNIIELKNLEDIERVETMPSSRRAKLSDAERIHTNPSPRSTDGSSTYFVIKNTPKAFHLYKKS